MSITFAKLSFANLLGMKRRVENLRQIIEDRYGRTVARVECQGQDASDYQVKSGMAWVFVKYSTDPGLMPIEAAAMAAGVGLWADARPLAPWAWRQAKR